MHLSHQPQKHPVFDICGRLCMCAAGHQMSQQSVSDQKSLQSVQMSKLLLIKKYLALYLFWSFVRFFLFLFDYLFHFVLIFVNSIKTLSVFLCECLHNQSVIRKVLSLPS